MKVPLLILLATSALAFIAACSASEEEVAPSGISPTPSPAQASSTAPTPSPVPSVSPAAVPADWKTYSDPGGLFRASYPAGWFPILNGVSSVDPSIADKGAYVESVHVEFSASIYDGYGCGVLEFDLASGQVSPQQGATESSLGGIPAWKIVRQPGDPYLNDPYTRIEAVSAIHKGYCFNVAAYFRQQDPDKSVFPAIIATFQFTF